MNEQRIPRSWLMLALGTSGQAASTTALYGLAYLVPAFQRELGLSLAGAGLLVSCPIFGILLGLIGWGVVADRYGERLALSAGLLIAAAVTAVAATVHGRWTLGALLILVGAAGSSVNSASGRLVIGWFPPDRRGIAMGVRQASQPLGTAVAAAALPPLAHHFGLSAAFGFCAALCGARAPRSPCAPSIRRAPGERRVCRPPRPRTRAATCGGCTAPPRCCASRSSW